MAETAIRGERGGGPVTPGPSARSKFQTMPNTLPDELLVSRACAGDSEAFGVLFRRHYARVHALCARITCDAFAADDLAQDTFVRVLRLGRSFSGRARFSTWLYRIARNVCIDHLQRVRRISLAEAQSFGEHSVSQEPRLGLLERALARLPADRREVIVLSRFHDLTYDELSDVLGCSVGAARVRVHRALSELKRIVHELEPSDGELSNRA